MKLSEKQLACLRQVALLGHAEGFAPNTVRSLENKGLVQHKRVTTGVGTYYLSPDWEVTEAASEYLPHPEDHDIVDGFRLVTPIHMYAAQQHMGVLEAGTLVELVRPNKGNKAIHRQLPYVVRYGSSDPFLLGRGHDPIKMNRKTWTEV